MTALPGSLRVTPPLTKLVSSRPEAAEVVKKLAEELQGSADCDFVAVALLQEDSLFFVPVKPERLPGSQGEVMPISKARLASECLERRAVVYEPDLSHKSQIGALEHLLPQQIRSLVAVPLLMSQSSVGALVLGSSRPNAYSREWQQLLSILGRQVGLHLENLMLLLELKQQEQARLQFLNVLCHELRTPLTPVLSSTGALREVLRPDPQSIEGELLNNILAGAENLRVRIDDLLDIAAFQAGAYRLNITHLDTQALLQEVCGFVQPEAARRGQRITVDIPDKLPQLRADRARVWQVLLNLLTNAMKFSPKGSSIEVRAGVPDQILTMEVKDHGQGLSPEEQARLFQPYFRTEQDRQRLPGLGLGLALSREIVEAHGGKISVESQVGRGSTFRITLPLDGPPRKQGERA